MVFSTARNGFVTHCQSALTLATSTVSAYSTDLQTAERFFGAQRPLTSVTKDDLRRYIAHLRHERKFMESSIKRRVASLKVFFRWAAREQAIGANPFDTLDERIRLPNRLPRALDRSDAGMLFRATIPHPRRDAFDDLGAKAAVQLLLGTGLRVGELFDIHIPDVSLADRCIRVHGKGNRQRLVYLLSPPLFDVLSLYLSKRQQIWPERTRLLITASGLDMTPQRVRIALHQIAADAGIKRRITPHMLRHTCATRWLESGLDIRYVQKLLGHQSISTTEIYTHVSDQGLREALTRISEQGGSRYRRSSSPVPIH